MNLDGLDDGPSPLLSLLQQSVFETNILRKLNAVDILISALDPDLAIDTKAMQMKEYLHDEILSNDTYTRQLQLFTRISEHPETAIEYYSTDYITHPEYHYDAKFAAKLQEVNKKVNHFIGVLIKELSRGEEIEL